VDLVDGVESLRPRYGSGKDVSWRPQRLLDPLSRSVHEVKLYPIGNEHLAKRSCVLMHSHAYSSSFQKNLDDPCAKQYNRA
jgi:hypothetical protein